MVNREELRAAQVELLESRTLLIQEENARKDAEGRVRQLEQALKNSAVHSAEIVNQHPQVTNIQQDCQLEDGSLGLRGVGLRINDCYPYTILQLGPKHCIKEGDTLEAVDGVKTQFLPVKQVKKLICGQRGTTVHLSLHRKSYESGVPMLYETTVRRQWDFDAVGSESSEGKNMGPGTRA
eukprot:CAMPEP_0172198384 /NCGR_PEP_ID=MMETSP1050-20130122/28049_1 /TAXON_ID=233186 /ORGANISM="Cryptomonas curvata, Strain CCAP979/52" /LENGTH=179 /DNA_ID=CAMNT_0012875183 /DNA_START=25 /DNA_END=564 /DNA_ORIENTATION=-